MHRALRQGIEHATRAQRHLAQGGVIGQHGQHHIGALSGFGNGWAWRRARDRGGLGRIAIPDLDAEAAGDEVSGDRGTHLAEAEDRDPEGRSVGHGKNSW